MVVAFAFVSYVFFFIVIFFFLTFWFLFESGEREHEVRRVRRWEGSGKSGRRLKNMTKIYYKKKIK